jgi:hypothetical protein
MRLPRRLPLPLNIAMITLLLAIAGSPLHAQTTNPLPSNWNDAVHVLAEKIFAALGTSRAISIEMDNISSLRETDAAEIQHQIESQLVKLGVHTGSATAAEAHVGITLSEGVEGYVWAAEVHKGEELQIAIVSASRSVNGGTSSIPSMSIQRNVLWGQPEKMLDFSVRPFLNGQGTVETALLPDRIMIYQAWSPGSRGVPSLLSPLSSIQPSRDMRGELIESQDHNFKTYVANTVCISGGGAGLFCAEQPGGGWPFPDGWEAMFTGGRNYFGGFAESDAKRKQVRFYSAATIDMTDGGYSRILTEPDGKARLYEDSRNPSATFEGWGDDIATIRTGCDGGWQVLVTGTGDWTQQDRIQIYEIRNHQGIAVGQPLNFPGPILAMWPAQDAKSVRVVSKNLHTGMYEASIVSVTCGN